MVIGNFFQSIGHAGKSIFLSVTRQMLFLIPMLAVLPEWWGLDGVWMAMPASDTISFVAATAMLIYMIKKIKSLPQPIQRRDEPQPQQVNPPLKGTGEAEDVS